MKTLQEYGGNTASANDPIKNAGKSLVLSSLPDLRKFAAKIHPLWLPALRTIELQLPFIDTTRQQAWQKKMQRLMRACGCFGGAVCTVLALGGCLAVGFSGGLDDVDGGLNGRRVVVAAGIVIAAGFLGKIISLALSRLILQRLVTQIIHTVETENNTT